MTLITLTVVQLLASILMVVILLKKDKRIKKKDLILAKVSVDYVQSTRKAQKYQKKYDDLLLQYGRDIGFKK